MQAEPIPTVLADTEWRIDDIVGRPVLEMGPATLRIESGGRLSGRTGCNLFTAAISVRGDRIEIAELATTRSVCPPALMEQEQRLIHSLRSVRGFSIDADGRLHFSGEYEPFLLRASPVRSGS